MNLHIDHFLGRVLHWLEPDGRPIPHRYWQRMLSKPLRLLIPAWHRSPWMEWRYGTWVGAFAGYDELGRQLGEANVLPEWRATPLNDNWRPFKGGGVRQGHPYNVDAMHEMVNCWDDLLLDALTLRAMYCRHYRLDESRRLGAKDLYVMTSIAVSISSFLLRRGDKPTPDGALPRQAAAAFKVIGGMYAASNRMLSQAHPMLLEAELDMDVFMQYLEDECLLLSPEMRACAGPVKMIRQMLSALINPTDTPLPEGGLAYLGHDAERAFSYGSLCVRIDLAVLLYWRSLGHCLRPLLQWPNTPVEVCNILVDEPELGLKDDIGLQAYLLMVSHIVNLFDDSEPEQALLSIAAQLETQYAVSVEAIGADCFRLEQVMRDFARQQQACLDHIMQIKSPPLLESEWSPAPGSDFLKNLFLAYPKIRFVHTAKIK